MMDDDIVLQLGLKDGRNADAAVAAESLLAWIDLARDAARAIDPNADVRVELLGRAEGSLRQFLRLVDDHAQDVSAGADEFPHLKKVAIGMAIAIATAGIQTFVQEQLQPEVQKVELSDRDRALLTRMTVAIERSEDAARSARRFFRAIEQDPAITNVTIGSTRSRLPLIVVDRAEFAMRGGLYSQEAEPPAEETRREIMSVVLMQAPFYASPKHWAFSRDGVRFTAAMADAAVLQAIVDGTMPISLNEGVRMEVEVEWRERLEGKVWVYLKDTRKIVRVLSPRPASSGPSYPPEKAE